jgi:hypothetical protein
VSTEPTSQPQPDELDQDETPKREPERESEREPEDGGSQTGVQPLTEDEIPEAGR